MHIGVLSEPNHFHTRKWIKGLKNTGVKVTLFSLQNKKQEGVETVYISPRYAKKGKLTYASYLFSSDRLAEELKKRKVEILNPINITPYGVWGSRTKFHPLVSVSMGADIFEFPPKHSSWKLPENRTWSVKDANSKETYIDKWKRHCFRYFVKECLQNSDAITGDNQLLIDCIHHWFHIPERKLYLNRWGIEEELFHMSSQEEAQLREEFQIERDQKVILSPRGMKPIYQGDIILTAFEKLLNEHLPHIKFIMLAAGYEIPDQLHAHASDLHKRYPNFHYVPGLIDRVKVCKLWNLVDMFVSAPVYDGYSNALSEGRYVGAIPFVNDIPATRELIRNEENGIVVDPFTPDRLSEMLWKYIPKIDQWKKKISGPNKRWILENAHLETNMQKFINLCSGM